MKLLSKTADTVVMKFATVSHAVVMLNLLPNITTTICHPLQLVPTLANVIHQAGRLLDLLSSTAGVYLVNVSHQADRLVVSVVLSSTTGVYWYLAKGQLISTLLPLLGNRKEPKALAGPGAVMKFWLQFQVNTGYHTLIHIYHEKIIQIKFLVLS